MTQLETIKLIKKAISKVKGEKIEVIDVKKRTPFTDFYILASAKNYRQINAIKESVVETLEENKINISHVEGKGESGWVLIDARQYIINIFSKEERERFNLESLLNNKKSNK